MIANQQPINTTMSSSLKPMIVNDEESLEEYSCDDTDEVHNSFLIKNPLYIKQAGFKPSVISRLSNKPTSLAFAHKTENRYRNSEDPNTVRYESDIGFGGRRRRRR
jgi:hypothetical protein